jgi:hypothetical protein
MRDVFSPRLRCIQGSTLALIQGVRTVKRVEQDTRNRAGFRDRGGGNGYGRDYHDRGRGDNSRAPQEQPRPQRGQGRLARPDRNRCPFLPDVQCAVCKKVGHVAKHCNMLTTAICLEGCMKNNLSALVRDTIEKDWLTQWKGRLGNPDGAPRQVLRTYVEELDITVARHDEAMEWDCRADNTPTCNNLDDSSE